MTLAQLNDMIALVAPIVGINSDGVIWFAPEATDSQKSAANMVMIQNLGELA